jgi:hypothetical protein
MNTHIRTLGLLTLALCAVNAQAYKYSVINHTANAHDVFVRFQDVAGLFAGEGALGTVQGKGGTVSKNFGFNSGRLIQCIMPQLRIDKDSTAVFFVSKAQLDDMLMMKDSPKMLNDYMYNNKIKPATRFLCFDRTFVMLQGSAGTSIVVTLKDF